jgi:hypothetical protein
VVADYQLAGKVIGVAAVAYGKTGVNGLMAATTAVRSGAAAAR